MVLSIYNFFPLNDNLFSVFHPLLSLTGNFSHNYVLQWLLVQMGKNQLASVKFLLVSILNNEHCKKCRIFNFRVSSRGECVLFIYSVLSPLEPLKKLHLLKLKFLEKLKSLLAIADFTCWESRLWFSVFEHYVFNSTFIFFYSVCCSIIVTFISK